MSEELFIEKVKELGITLSEEQKLKLNQYYELLVEWNQKMNLTGITKKEDVYLKHFYDSLTLYQVIDLNKVETLCDIGTGAGFPGIVLKICFPNLKITLVDSLQKRVQFLNFVIEKLNLKKIEAISARIEEYGKYHREEFELVTARAVAPLNILLEYATPMIKVGKYFAPMKGNISQEMREVDHALQELNLKIVEKKEFLLPIEESKRTILLFQKQEKTKEKYPRKFSEIKKRPL